MKADATAFQTHWHSDDAAGGLPDTPDTAFLFFAWDRLVRLSAAAGPPGRVLDVACGDARDIAALSRKGWEGWGLDPSPLQLRDARKAVAESGWRINLVQGVAEWLPFKPGVFDSLICKSALDHFADHDGAVRGFARVLRPEGRAVVSFNNYGGLSVRAGRLLYRIVRALWPRARSKHFLYDSPVPMHHTCECTFDNIRALGDPYFDVADSYGVSFFWGLPGWGRFLSLIPQRRIANGILRVINRLAMPLPRWADVTVFVWRPKASQEERNAT
jgi:SAM-dependent methyltransferase